MSQVVAAPCAVCGRRDARPVFTKQGWTFVRCAECRAMRIHPLPDAAELVEVYERLYRDGAYVSFAAADDVRMATAVARLDAIRAFAPPGPWLDVGCSTGAFLRVARDGGIEIEGLDISETAVERVRADGFRATASPIEDFTPAQRLAVVTAFDLVEHLLDPGVFLGRVRDWLLPGGCLVVSVPDIGSVHARVMRSHWYYYAPPLHVHYFDRRSFTALMARYGLRVQHLGAAPKRLTPRYAVESLGLYNPRLGAAMRQLVRRLPAAWRTRPMPMPVGELLAIATAA